MHEDRVTDHVTHDAADDVDRMFVRADLDQPFGASAWTGQLEAVAAEPDDEDLGLDRPLHVDAVRQPRHRPMVRATRLGADPRGRAERVTRSPGADLGQGFLFARPLDPAATAALLTDGRSLDEPAGEQVAT